MHAQACEAPWTCGTVTFLSKTLCKGGNHTDGYKWTQIAVRTKTFTTLTSNKTVVILKMVRLKRRILYERWWMVNARLCKTTRLAFFLASPRNFDFFNCKRQLCEKNRDCETHITTKKRDCETHEIQWKFCKAHGFWRTIHHPFYDLDWFKA